MEGEKLVYGYVWGGRVWSRVILGFDVLGFNSVFPVRNHSRSRAVLQTRLKNLKTV